MKPATEYNLDCMDRVELMNFSLLLHQKRPLRWARQLFPNRRKGIIIAAKLLGHYACNKSVAMGLRLEGNIARATEYEAICDRIYKALPDWAKGW